MDVPLKSKRRLRWIRGVVSAVVLLLVAAFVYKGMERVGPAAPAADRASVQIATVERGKLVREVQGPGRLVPEVVRWVVAPGEGRVEDVKVRPGAEVSPETALVELSNAALDRELAQARGEVGLAEAELTALQARREQTRLELEAAAIAAQARVREAQQQLTLDETTFNYGKVWEIRLALAKGRVEEMARLSSNVDARVKAAEALAVAEEAAQKLRLEQARTRLTSLEGRYEGLHVKARFGGVVEQVLVESGQAVSEGASLARIYEPAPLKAVIRLPEVQARDVLVGQTARIDTRNGIAAGRVVRIEPSVRDGAVSIDVSLTDEAPKGARPDLSVSGTIVLEEVEEVLRVARPVFSEEHQTLTLFKLDADGGGAIRTQVRLGRSSVNQVEVVEGLQAGDRVIVSDMERWKAVDRIRLK